VGEPGFEPGSTGSSKNSGADQSDRKLLLLKLTLAIELTLP